MANKIHDSAGLLDNLVLPKPLKSDRQVEIKQFKSQYDNMLIFQIAEREPSPDLISSGVRTVWIQWVSKDSNPAEKQIEILDTLSDDPNKEVFLVRPDLRDKAIEILRQPDPYVGPERWSRRNHYGLVDSKTETGKIVNRLKKIWYGQCPHCRVTLIEMPGWAGSECPQCGKHFS
jgi:hypothetical protein